MNKYLRTGLFVFLVAVAIQARVVRQGDLTPIWPAVIALAVVGLAVLRGRRHARHRAPEA